MTQMWLPRPTLRKVLYPYCGARHNERPYLVLMKLAAGRLQDLADIGRMLGAADDSTLEAARRIVRRYRAGDAEDLESMIRLGKLEYE